MTILPLIATEQNAVVVTVLHENPDSEYGKTRGHLGSQLERKAESNLRLQKDNTTGVTTIFTEKSRHCHIPKGQGSRFRWDDESWMHLSCPTSAEEKEVDRLALLKDEADTLAKMCGPEDFLRKDAVEALKKIRDVKQTAGINRLKILIAEGLVVLDSDTGKLSMK